MEHGSLEAEGWFRDPYGVHQDRWYSIGRPTPLVRDDGVESTDPAPPGPAPGGPLVPAAAPPPVGNVDLQRADQAEQPPADASYARDQGEPAAPQYGEAAFEAAPNTGPA
jgi:hypothetical protein